MASSSESARPSVKVPTYAPVVLASGTFSVLALCSYLGFKQSFKQYNAAEARRRNGDANPLTHEPLRPTAALRTRIPNSNLGAGGLAAKALLYGTALCFVGFGAAGAVVALALGVRDIDGLARQLEAVLSPMRRAMEGLSAGQLRLPVPAPGPGDVGDGTGPGGSLQGLTPSEKRVMRDFMEGLGLIEPVPRTAPPDAKPGRQADVSSTGGASVGDNSGPRLA